MDSRHLHSLREYVDALTGLGDVLEWSQDVDPGCEVVAVIRRCHDTGAPAPLFTRIRGHDGVFRVLGATDSPSSLSGAPFARVALSLGLPPSSTGLRIVRALARAYSAAPVACVVADSGPCQENVVRGRAVDLTRLPFPQALGDDAAPRATPWGVVVVASPDGRWTNWSLARLARLDRTRLIGALDSRDHLGRIFRMWADVGRPMPFAFVLGAEPAVPIAAGMVLPAGVDQLGFLGGFFGAAQVVVRCRTVDLHVPATAEVVVEGEVAVGGSAFDGPAGDRDEEARLRATCHVSAITHRDGAILPVVVSADQDARLWTVSGITASAALLHRIRQAGLPVSDVWCAGGLAPHSLVVAVPRDWRERNGFDSEQLRKAVVECADGVEAGVQASRLLLIDADADPAASDEVVSASTGWPSPSPRRCHAGSSRPLLSSRLRHDSTELETPAGP